MSNPWFRMYSEFADDPKVQIMPEHMQRRLLMLMCSRCKDETLHETQRAFHWRISMEQLAETKALFIENGFIDEGWALLNWDKRQFLSDSSTDRVRRHRSGLKRHETLQHENVTFQKHTQGVTVTPPDTEQIQNRTEEVTPQMVSRGVREDLSISGQQLTNALDDICKYEMKKGVAADSLRESLVSAYRDYQAGDIEFKQGALNFFGTGTWKNRKDWKYMAGKGPKPASPPNMIERVRREREELDRKDGRIQ